MCVCVCIYVYIVCVCVYLNLQSYIISPHGHILPVSWGRSHGSAPRFVESKMGERPGKHRIHRGYKLIIYKYTYGLLDVNQLDVSHLCVDGIFSSAMCDDARGYPTLLSATYLATWALVPHAHFGEGATMLGSRACNRSHPHFTDNHGQPSSSVWHSIRRLPNLLPLKTC